MSHMKYLLVDRPSPGVLRARLNRPQRRNAIDATVLDELESVFAAPDQPIVVLGSTDRRAFCAGGDLTLDPDELATLSDRLFAFYAHLITLPNILVLAVDGAVRGAGAQLLLCADLRVGGPDTSISWLGARSGLALGTWRLPQLVGSGRASDLALTGREIRAQEALSIGLLDRLVDDADAEATQIAAELGRAPDGVAAQIKELLRGEDSAVRLECERTANAAHRLDRTVIGT
jgi:2-(1,2-epoxy-1,2-dihydrophenyl)acetyl-CoA isomerase